MIIDGAKCEKCGAWVSSQDTGFNPGRLGLLHEGCGGRWVVEPRDFDREWLAPLVSGIHKKIHEELRVLERSWGSLRDPRLREELRKRFRAELASRARQAWRNRNYNYLAGVCAEHWLWAQPECREIYRKQSERRARKAPVRHRTVYDRLRKLISRRYGTDPLLGNRFACWDASANVGYMMHDEVRAGRCVRCGAPASSVSWDTRARRAALEFFEKVKRLKRLGVTVTLPDEDYGCRS